MLKQYEKPLPSLNPVYVLQDSLSYEKPLPSNRLFSKKLPSSYDFNNTTTIPTQNKKGVEVCQ